MDNALQLSTLQDIKQIQSLFPEQTYNNTINIIKLIITSVLLGSIRPT